MLQDVFMAMPLGILLCFLIGPVFFIVLETAATKGFRAAIVFDLGVVTGDILFIAIAVFSSYKIIDTLKNEPVLYIVGGLIMVTYGVFSLIKLKRNGTTTSDKMIIEEIIKTDYKSLYFKGFFLNIINVGVFGFWLLIFVSFGPILELEPQRMWVFFSSVILTYLLVDIIKMMLAKNLKHHMTPENIIKIKKLTSVLLVIFGISIMLQGWFPSDQKLVKKALEKIEPKEK